MTPYLDSLLDAIVDRSPEELIGGIFLALLLALLPVGAYAASRRKGKDAAMTLAVVAMVANLAGMVAVAGYVRLSHVGGRAPERGQRMPGPVDHQAGQLAEYLSYLALVHADADHDHVLTIGEAAAGSDAFVKALFPSGEGKLDFEALRAGLQDRLRPPDVAPGYMPGDASKDAGDGAMPRGFPR